MRCIRPNANQEPDNFDTEEVHRQLLTLGVLEALKLREETLPVFWEFEAFVARYRFIIAGSYFSEVRESVQAIMQVCMRVCVLPTEALPKRRGSKGRLNQKGNGRSERRRLSFKAYEVPR